MTLTHDEFKMVRQCIEEIEAVECVIDNEFDPVIEQDEDAFSIKYNGYLQVGMRIARDALIAKVEEESLPTILRYIPDYINPLEKKR